MPPCSLVDWYQSPSLGKNYLFILLYFYSLSFLPLPSLTVLSSLYPFFFVLFLSYFFFSSHLLCSYFISLISFRLFTSFLFDFLFSFCFEPNLSFFQFHFLLHVFCSTKVLHHHARKMQRKIPQHLRLFPAFLPFHSVTYLYIPFYLLG